MGVYKWRWTKPNAAPVSMFELRKLVEYGNTVMQSGVERCLRKCGESRKRGSEGAGRGYPRQLLGQEITIYDKKNKEQFEGVNLLYRFA